MATACPFCAFGMPGYGELAILLVVGLLIFGRRLPDVGRAVGKTVTQFRRGLHDFKEQMNRDEDLREAKSAVKDLRNAVEAPRKLTDPKRMLEKLTDEELATPGPDTTQVAPAVGKGPLEQARDELPERADG